MTNSYTEKMREIKEQKHKLESLLKDNLLNMYKCVFDEHPEIFSFAFTGYTPYFNDGDPCYYSINEIHAINNNDFDGFADSFRNINSFLDMIYDIHNEFKSQIQKYGEGEYVVSYDGNTVSIKVEDYDHD